MIEHVLLVPAEGDPHGLLAPGACGATVPLAVLLHDGWRLGWSTFQPTALVLAWDGVPCVEGCDRVARIYMQKAPPSCPGFVLQVEWSMEDAVELAEAIAYPNVCGGEVVTIEAPAPGEAPRE